MNSENGKWRVARRRQAGRRHRKSMAGFGRAKRKKNGMLFIQAGWRNRAGKSAIEAITASGWASWIS